MAEEENRTHEYNRINCIGICRPGVKIGSLVKGRASSVGFNI